ncbi:MAG: hypothetical protein DI528_17420 [Shinella sp.]|nr:MAG: hypothetical protein DI528_17420 [Shinella sp.]
MTSFSTARQFPPPSTTLPHLLVDGSDHQFRGMVYDLLSLSAMMLKTRELYGAYIGVSAPQYTILMVVAEHGSTTVGRLAATLHTSGPFITSEVNKLVKRGHLRRRPNDTDRRSTYIELTDFGRAEVLKVAPMRTCANDIVFGSLKPAEAAMFQHLVGAMVKDLERAIHTLEGPDWDRAQSAAASLSEGR